MLGIRRPLIASCLYGGALTKFVRLNFDLRHNINSYATGLYLSNSETNEFLPFTTITTATGLLGFSHGSRFLLVHNGSSLNLSYNSRISNSGRTAHDGGCSFEEQTVTIALESNCMETQLTDRGSWLTCAP